MLFSCLAIKFALMKESVLSLDKRSDIPLYRQIYALLKEKISALSLVGFVIVIGTLLIYNVGRAKRIRIFRR